MAHNKTISLDETTALLAERMPNFSAWVRFHLREWARNAGHVTQAAEAVHVAPPEARVWGDKKDKCNPRHLNGLCPTCYPEGF